MTAASRIRARITRTAKKIGALLKLQHGRDQRIAAAAHGTGEDVAKIRRLKLITARRIANLTLLNRIRRRRLAKLVPKAPYAFPIVGVDFVSFTPKQAKAVGAHYGIMYASGDPDHPENNPKNATKAKVAAWHAEGLGVWIVWETTAKRALEGKAAGIHDARLFERHLHNLGAPSGMARPFANDTDASGNAIAAYFRGARSICGNLTAIYGGLDAVKFAHEVLGIIVCWQTLAWSRGQWYKHAQIRQDQIHGQYDRDMMMSNVAIWWP